MGDHANYVHMGKVTMLKQRTMNDDPLASTADWDAVDALLSAAVGRYSAVVLDGAGRTCYARDAHAPHAAASLIKVVIALTVERLAQAGVLTLDDTATLHAAVRVEGEGAVDTAAAGSVWRLRQLRQHMLNESDNTASNMLIDVLDTHGDAFALVNAEATRLGATHTQLQRRFMDFVAARAGRQNVTTAHDVAQVFQHLHTTASPLLAPLHGSVVDTKLVAGVPEEVRIAHKVGNLEGVEHDVGIIYAPGGAFVVALLGSELPVAVTGEQTLAAATRLIYERMTRA